MSNYVTVGALTASEAAATLGTGTPTATVSFTGTKEKSETTWKDAANAILTNFYRGKISREQMAAQQRALELQRQQQGGMGQYLPFIAIGGVVLIAVLLLKR